MTAEEYTDMALRIRSDLYQIGFRFWGNEADADDIVQETLFRLWQVHSRLNTEEDFRRLSVRIAKNQCISLWRQRKTAPSYDLAEAYTLSRTEPDCMEEAENENLLQRAISMLAPAEKRIFLLWQQEMDVGSIAAVTGAKPRTVSSMLSLAKRKIFEHLKKAMI